MSETSREWSEASLELQSRPHRMVETKSEQAPLACLPASQQSQSRAPSQTLRDKRRALGAA